MKRNVIISIMGVLVAFLLGLILSPYVLEPLTSAGTGSTSVTTASQSSGSYKKEIYILEAATLKPLVDMLREIASQRGYVVYDEAKGSTQLAREINDLSKRADLFIPIDTEVVEKILFPSGAATWYIVIATSSMVLVYSNSSEDKVRGLLDLLSRGDPESFFNELLSGQYRIGLGNPDNVPQGYRTIMIMKLAGLLIKGDENYYLARFNELVKSGKAVYTRDAAALVSLLQTGQIDVSFTYLHEAKLFNLKYARLPDDLSLSNPAKKDLYSRVNYTTSQGVVIRGNVIEIPVTIPRTAVNREAALSLISYLLTSQGRDLMVRAGLIPLEKPEIRGVYQDLLG
ncbi:MAG TPA: extracellular solute-binding protein [Sulfolobales archaeon]|nr:extracellular solute-binding protein [Sulfolobales archaeon]